MTAKRLPAVRPGRGGAARYVSGKMPVNARSFHRQQAGPLQVDVNAIGGSAALQGAGSEDERIAAMLQLGAEDWAQQSQHLARFV